MVTLVVKFRVQDFARFCQLVLAHWVFVYTSFANFLLHLCQDSDYHCARCSQLSITLLSGFWGSLFALSIDMLGWEIEHKIPWVQPVQSSVIVAAHCIKRSRYYICGMDLQGECMLWPSHHFVSFYGLADFSFHSTIALTPASIFGMSTIACLHIARMCCEGVMSFL